ncbi:hypothetical protein Dimus_004012 [Dionaea muscipula]
MGCCPLRSGFVCLIRLNRIPPDDYALYCELPSQFDWKLSNAIAVRITPSNNGYQGLIRVCELVVVELREWLAGPSTWSVPVGFGVDVCDFPFCGQFMLL